MSPERWHKINELFEAALEVPGGERAAFLTRACADDQELQQRVQAMLDADQQTDLLLDRSPLAASSFPSLRLDAIHEKMIGPYRLLRELGHGGMGVVYAAFDTRLERQVALKLLPARLMNETERVQRFQREARTVSALNHPNIITIHDFGETAGHFYIASEFVEGETLRAFVGAETITLSQFVEVMIQVASALDAAHTANIIHRDIKPENVMLRPDGYVKVLDFGLAKLTEAFDSEDNVDPEATTKPLRDTSPGVIMGTVSYMSPEQSRGQKVDSRSDIFSLGVVLYEMVTGRKPFAGDTMSDVLAQILEREPEPLTRAAAMPRLAGFALKRTIGILFAAHVHPAQIEATSSYKAMAAAIPKLRRG